MCSALGNGFQAYADHVAMVKASQEAQKKAKEAAELEERTPKCELCRSKDTELTTYGDSVGYLACTDVVACEERRSSGKVPPEALNW